MIACRDHHFAVRGKRHHCAKGGRRTVQPSQFFSVAASHNLTPLSVEMASVLPVGGKCQFWLNGHSRESLRPIKIFPQLLPGRGVPYHNGAVGHAGGRQRSPAGANATDVTDSSCPRNSCNGCAVAASQRMTVSSALAVARRLPSGERATPPTGLLWAVGCCKICLPLPTSSRQTELLLPAAAAGSCRWEKTPGGTAGKIGQYSR